MPPESSQSPTVQPGDVIVEEELGRYFVSRVGATRQLSFRRYEDALRLSLAYSRTHHVAVFVLGDDRVFRVVTSLSHSSPMALPIV